MSDEHTAADGRAMQQSAINAPGTRRYAVKNDRWSRAIDHIKREWQLYVMLLPTIIWFVVFLYKPMYGLQIAFKDYSIFRGVGYENIPPRHYDFVFIDGPGVTAPSDGAKTFDFDFINIVRDAHKPVCALIDGRYSTCYVYQRVFGVDKVRFDVFRDSLQARKKIG